MKIGYACKHQTLGSANKKITYKKLSTYDLQKQYDTLYNLSKINLNNLKEIILQNINDNIFMFRISSGLFPLACHPEIVKWWEPTSLFKKELEEIGSIITQHNVRVSLHPGQFNVLTNNNPNILNNTLNELGHSYRILYNLKLSYTPDIIIHMGGKYGDMKQAIHNLINNFRKLSNECKNMIRFENDQHIYTAQQVYHVCKHLGVPMILDVEHHKHNNGKINLETAFYLAMDTWDEKLTPKIHLSTQSSEYNKHAHSDYISTEDFYNVYKFLEIYKFDIMLECKKTNESLYKLKKDLILNNIYI